MKKTGRLMMSSVFLSVIFYSDLTSADCLSEQKIMNEALGKCIDLSNRVNDETLVNNCIKNMEELPVTDNCDKFEEEKQLACYRDLSDKGGSCASWKLGQAYAGESDKGFSGKPLGLVGLPFDEGEATKWKLLAYKQGESSAKLWFYNKYIPPQPYKWEIGMSKNQVLHSIDGAPVKRISRTSVDGNFEVWVYNGAILQFAPQKKWGLLEAITEEK